MGRINMRNWNDEALLIVAEQTPDELMKRAIKSILIERYSKGISLNDLYRKLKRGQNIRNDILWSSIMTRFMQDHILVEITRLDEMFENMPMDYLAIIACSSPNEYIRQFAAQIGHAKQEVYEREIGIYDKTAEKFELDEIEMKLEMRKKG